MPAQPDTHYAVPAGALYRLVSLGDVVPRGDMKYPDAGKVERFAEWMARGVPIEPIHLQSGNVIGDGHHRYLASLRRGHSHIPVRP